MPKIHEILREATDILQASGIDEPRREANSLLSFALGKDRGHLIAHAGDQISEAENSRFQSILARRAAHEPFQQIAGRQEFYRLDFIVTPDVLIPRPETELIVENALEILSAAAAPRFCEVGVGSGCISVAILHENENAAGTAFDISEKALEVARKNAEKHGVSERLELEISDVFAALKDEKFDLIVSNPPYIPSEEIAALQAEVRDFEPIFALTDGKDGLSIIEKIVLGCPRFLKPEGFLLIEIGFNQSEKVRAMFDSGLWRAVDFFPDLQGIPRMLKAQIKS